MFLTDSQPELRSKYVLRKSFYVYSKSVAGKTGRCRKVILAVGDRFSVRCRCREVAVVERFKQELMYGLSAGTKKSGRCREVAVRGGSIVF